MFRIAIAFVALAVFASVASAQPRRLPLAPGVTPGSPWGPGMPFTPVPSNPNQPATALSGVGFPGFGFPGNGFFGGGFYTPVVSPFSYGWGPFYNMSGAWFGYDPGVTIPPPFTPLPSTNGYAGPAEPTVALANEFPARLTLQLPAAGEVWMDGKKVSAETSASTNVKYMRSAIPIDWA